MTNVALCHARKIIGVELMRRPALCGFLRLVVLIACCRCIAESPGFTVRDSIEMQTFSIPSQLAPDDPPDWSPDRHHFVVVTSRGLLSTNKIESTIWLFDSSVVSHFLGASSGYTTPVPRAIAKVSATPKVQVHVPYAALISDIRWSSDSSLIYFLGQNSDGERQLYRVALRREVAEILTPRGLDVRRYDFTAHSIAYTAARSTTGTSWATPEEARRPRPVTGTQLTDILFPEQAVQAKYTKLWLIGNNGTREIRRSADEVFPADRDYYGDLLSMSPNGHSVVRLRSVQTIPESWTHYEPLPGFDSWRISTGDSRLISSANIYRLRQYVLVDLTSGKVSPLLDAPLGSTLAYTDDTNHAVWSPDGRRLVLTNTFLSLTGADPEKQREYIHPCAAASLDVVTGTAHCIVQSRIGSSRVPKQTESLRLQEASFREDDDHIVLTFNDSRQAKVRELYKYVDHRWIVDSGAAIQTRHDLTLSASAGVEVTLRQGLNDHPVLWAVDRTSGKERELWDPNPQFAHMNFSSASVYHWTDSTGYLWTAGLVKPVGYVTGRQYPLVIQTHGFSRNEFITDGAYPTAMAARPLASAGFIVLQIADRTDHYGSGQEAADQLEGYRTAIKQLSTDGLIDAAHVGIIGFSRTCWYVETALTLEPHLFAAATIADGVDFSYMQYMLFGEGRVQFEQEYERINAGPPFGAGLEKWVEQAPGFHLDKVQTPLRIEAIGNSSILQEWELYSALRQQHKPVDLVYFPEGQHILQSPSDRMMSQQGDVDWLRFWLEGYRSHDITDPSQYVRWNDLRAQQPGLIEAPSGVGAPTRP